MGALQASLLLLALILPSPQAHSAQLFKEAPEFHNAATCPPSPPVHVAMTVNSRYLRGSMAAILSTLKHSDCPENLRFHLITPMSSSNDINSTITTSFPYLHVAVYPFSSSSISGRISSSIRAALDSPSNYARNYIAHLLPLKKVVYLDSDVILVDDIAKLYNHPMEPSSVIAAPEYCKTNITAYFTPTFWSNPSLAAEFSDRKPCYFNTGVMVVDLVKWREGDYTTQIVEWMELQKRMRIYELGSLPPLMLVFGGRISAVDHRWNKHGLGGDNYKGLCRKMHPGPVSLLHWSGKGKPWVRIDEGRPCPLDALWAPYDLLEKDQPLISSF